MLARTSGGVAVIQLAHPKDVPALLQAGLTVHEPVDEDTLDVCWHLHLRFFDRVSTLKWIAERCYVV